MKIKMITIADSLVTENPVIPMTANVVPLENIVFIVH